MRLPLIASCGYASVNTPLPVLAGSLSAPEHCSLFNQQSFKALQGYQLLRESLWHLNNYLPRFLIINSFNLFTLNQFYIIIQLSPGGLPTFPLLSQSFQRCILPPLDLQMLVLRSSHPLVPKFLFSTACPFFVFDSSSANGMWFSSSVHPISLHPLLTFHQLSIIDEWWRLHFFNSKMATIQQFGGQLYLGGFVINFVITSWKKAQNDMRK